MKNSNWLYRKIRFRYFIIGIIVIFYLYQFFSSSIWNGTIIEPEEVKIQVDKLYDQNEKFKITLTLMPQKGRRVIYTSSKENGYFFIAVYFKNVKTGKVLTLHHKKTLNKMQKIKLPEGEEKKFVFNIYEKEIYNCRKMLYFSNELGDIVLDNGIYEVTAILFFFAHPGKVDNINTEYSPLKSNTIIIEVGSQK